MDMGQIGKEAGITVNPAPAAPKTDTPRQK